jgi:hypothetical protein
MRLESHTKPTSQITLQRSISDDLGRRLEESHKEAQAIDRDLTRTLGYYANPVRDIPILGRVVKWGMSIKPLTTLEMQLGRSLRKSVEGLVEVGVHAQGLTQRVSELKEVYAVAEAEKWGQSEFMAYFENHSNMDFSVKLGETTYDFKDFVHMVSENTSAGKKEQEHQDYLRSFGSHISVVENYASTMRALTLVGSKWVGNMAQSYFGLQELQPAMQLMERTMRVLGVGSTTAVGSHQALREYCGAYAKGVSSLLEGYEKVRQLQASASDTVTPKIEALEQRLYELTEPLYERKQMLPN